ncbi:MAG TPA: 3-keto-5-aminohexanoate cleavage protein [Gaiellaceae bacterium]|nr:3-keto-5-aminohexanoate cleavage protein [Gaiellaceae bacterium]
MSDTGWPPLLVNAALTGMVPTKADNPAVPITPEEIAEDAERCVRAGASVVHLHARDRDGRPTYERAVYAEIVAAVRERCPDVLVCVSTSGRLWPELEKRAAVLDLEGALKPDLASLTLGSLNFPTQASVNEPATIRGLAERMAERGIVPELEVFDLGMVDYLRFLLDRGVLRPPLYVNLLLGSLGTIAATPLNLALLVQALPEGATWSATGIGRFQFRVNALAIASGGHVRVGLEDNLWLDEEKTQPATNAALVERLVGVARACGRTPATPAQARELIGLPLRVAG